MKAIIFDFGNVVGFFDHQRTLQRLAVHSDMPPAEMYRAVYEGDLEDAFESGKLSMAEFLGKTRELCGLRCDVDFMHGAFADIFVPNPEVCELIPQLKRRYRILLGSNTNELHATHFQKQFAEVLGHFDGLVLSYKLGARKPRREFFEECRRLAECPASECVFVDDLPANIEGARAAGLQAILYAPNQDLRGQLRSLGADL